MGGENADRGEASEDPQPGEYQEDMYGNPVP